MNARKTTLLAALAAALFLLLVGCQASVKSSAGFRLPDGDPAAGQRTFVEMRCNACHEVAGVQLPAPTASPAVPVRLGGEVAFVKTDGELVTSIIDPSHQIEPGYQEELVKRGSLSRMPSYDEIMTVRQLIDVVAFLHPRYTLVRPGAGPK